MRAGFVCACVLLAVTPLSASQLFIFSDVSGLSAEVEFTLINATTLEVRAQNTSTDAPDGFDAADQLLTGISWDFAPPGLTGNTSIIGGIVLMGPSSQTVNFSTGFYGPGTDVSGEFGYGNFDGTGLLPNFISATVSQTTPFGGANLDGPGNIDGPQGGLVANPPVTSLGGLGAIQDEIIATLQLSAPLDNLDFLSYGVRIEFGSDAAHLQQVLIPEPASALILIAGATFVLRRNRR
jgi:hypothetical protein